MTLLATLALSFLIVVLAVAGMSIGVIAGRAPIKGSCGGVGSAGCELCSGNCRRRNRVAAADTAIGKAD
jgi:hypothetical protein